MTHLYLYLYRIYIYIYIYGITPKQVQDHSSDLGNPREIAKVELVYVRQRRTERRQSRGTDQREAHLYHSVPRAADMPAA
jgi:hypothetical protein